MPIPAFRYLNQDPAAFQSVLIEKLGAMQKSATAKQWAQIIQGLPQKGVKNSEILDSAVLAHLMAQPDDAKLTRAELIDWLRAHTPTIKEVPLAHPSYEGWKQSLGPNQHYQEILYVLNSETDNMDDAISILQFEIEELGFNLEKLAADPMAAIRMSEQYEALVKRRATEKKDYVMPHFGGVQDPESHTHIKNVMGHTRVSTSGNLFFVHEIQSDWAQRGRKGEWKGIPLAPFVTTTEAWSGLILRRQMQRAAENPDITQFAWILGGGMRNGAIGTRPSGDGIDKFYQDILPKIANQALSGTGEKVRFFPIRFGSDGEEKTIEVPGFMMTDKAREKLMQAQPLYSRDVIGDITPYRTPQQQEILEREIIKMREMLGDMVSIRLATRLIDAATGDPVAGRQTARLIEVSLAARNPVQAMRHEGWHYAHQYLLGHADRQAIERAFAPGTRLNADVRHALVAAGASPDAISQCDDPQEASAHGFALWSQGLLPLTAEARIDQEAVGLSGMDRVVGGIFRKVESAFVQLGNWLRRVTHQDKAIHEARRVETIFNQLRSGRLQACAQDPFEAMARSDDPIRQAAFARRERQTSGL